MTSAGRENRMLPPGVEPDPKPYVELQNPIVVDRNVMRKSLLASMIEVVEHNSRLRERIALFEIGPIYLAGESEDGLPDELSRLVIALSGQRGEPDWLPALEGQFDYYDLKGVTDELLEGLHLGQPVAYQDTDYPMYHPGKCARITVGGRQVGVLGELHPAVHAQLELGAAPVLAAALDLDTLRALTPDRHDTAMVPNFPPVLEDLALIVAEDMPAAMVEDYIRQTGGADLADVRLFDVYRGDQIGAGKKSLAYALTYQAPDRTLTDNEVAKLRKKIVGRLEREVGAVLRA
jgi:phenylalanyl-tRNA synthetase beta chain